MTHAVRFSKAGYRDTSVNFDGNAPADMSVLSGAAGPDDRKEVQPMTDDEGRTFYRIPLAPE